MYYFVSAGDKTQGAGGGLFSLAEPSAGAGEDEKREVAEG